MMKGIIQQWFDELPDEEITQYNINQLITMIKTKQFRITYKHPDKVVKLKDLIGDNK